MKAAWLVVITAACNPVFGIQQTVNIDASNIDAQYFDAPADAPPACPAPGGEPKFSGAYRQVDTPPQCDSYIPAAAWGSAVAYCPSLGIAQGLNDQALVTSTLTPPSDRYRFPRVSPDGTILFVENALTLMVDVFKRNEDNSWSLTRSMPDASYRFISNPTQGPVRRALQTDFNGSAWLLIELEEQATGEWTEVDRFFVTDIGMGNVEQVSLSSDGLHVTMTGQALMATSSGVYYAQRSDRDSRFGMAIKLTTVPAGINTPFMTDNCSRFYFSALNAVFYQSQQ